MVRNMHGNDEWEFTEGMNEAADDYCPKGEIWIEAVIHETEIPVTVLHEFVERALMIHKKMQYDEAHIEAAKAEWAHRGHFTKKDVAKLTEENVLNGKVCEICQ